MVPEEALPTSDMEVAENAKSYTLSCPGPDCEELSKIAVLLFKKAFYAKHAEAIPEDLSVEPGRKGYKINALGGCQIPMQPNPKASFYNACRIAKWPDVTADLVDA